MGKVYVGQVGVRIEVETGGDLSEATTTDILYRTPSHVPGTWTGTVEGTKLVYTTTSAEDLPVKGTYVLQAKVAGVGFSLLGETSAELVIYAPWQ